MSVLRQKYPSCGTNIPELLGRHSAPSIRSTAGRLGIIYEGSRSFMGRSIVYKDVTYDSVFKACEAANLYHGAVSQLVSQLQVSHQEAFDILLKRKQEASPSDFPLVLGDFVCNNLDDVAAYFGLSSKGVIRSYMSAKKCDLATAIEYYRSSNPRRSCLGYSSFRAVSYAYRGTDGLSYFFCICSRCNSVLLLPSDKMGSFQHGELCASYCIPDILEVPAQITKMLREIKAGQACL